MSAEAYYANSNSSNWGNYQYVTLEEVISNYMMSRDEDDYTATVPRFKVLYQAMRGLRELYYDVLQEIRAIEIELSPALTITLPPDYVSYVRISWVDENGLLRPMAKDTRMGSIAEEYLQDHQYNLLFDDQGCVLIGNSPDGEDGNAFDPDADTPFNPVYSYQICDGFQPNRNMAEVFTNGKYRIDKNAGVIYFGSDVQGKFIVLEYISDGLFTGCEGRPEDEIRVHKFAESAMLDWMYYQLIKNRKKVPYNEKMRARKEYYNSRRIAKVRLAEIRKDELLQSFRGSSRWIKQ